MTGNTYSSRHTYRLDHRKCSRKISARCIVKHHNIACSLVRCCSGQISHVPRFSQLSACLSAMHQDFQAQCKSYLPSARGTTTLQCNKMKKKSWDTFYDPDGTITVEEEHFSHILVHAAVFCPLEYHSAVRVQLHRLICSQFYHSAEQDSSIALSAFFTLLELLDRLVKMCNQICFNGFSKERYNLQRILSLS